MSRKSQKSEFVELLTPNYYKIHSFILSLVLNKTDAEDILQSSITYLWEHFEDFEPGTNFLSWAFTVSKYQVLTYRKKKQRSIIHFSEEAVQLIESENQILSRKIDLQLEILKDCMKKLQSKDLTFIKKRFEEKTTVLDLASKFNISINVAYKRISKIKSLLLNCIHKAITSGDVL